MSDFAAFVPCFLTATVEWVEAFTIVLAVSLSIGWGQAGLAALSALVTLAALTAATGGALQLGAALGALQFVVGVFLSLFGVRWLAKAIARHAGLKPLHDEDEEFRATRAATANADRWASWLIAYKGVLLEGLEVWLVVVALSLHKGLWTGNVAAALISLLLVVLSGLALRAPLARVPENAIKFCVGAMLTAFGTFWTLESLAPDAFPIGDWSIAVMAAFYLAGGLAVAAMLRARGTQSA